MSPTPLQRTVVLLLGLVLGAGCSATATGTSTEGPTATFSTSESPTLQYSPLTGMPIEDPALATRGVLGVIIENSSAARPQSGLAAAGVVFEAIAEGGITRFIALYQDSTPALIGPVRSVRPYFLEWALPFDAAIAHVGGSTEALSMLASGGYGVDLDQQSNGSAYWRSTDRSAPHNVYTDFDQLSTLATANGHANSDFVGFDRTDQVPIAESATNLTLGISAGVYQVRYTFDAATGTYLRYHGDQPHLDREMGQLAPRVVIALRVAETLHPDGQHELIETSGGGEAFIFQAGGVVSGRWHKAGPNDQLTFTTLDGAEIELVRGQTWITAVPNQNQITWQ